MLENKPDEMVIAQFCEYAIATAEQNYFLKTMRKAESQFFEITIPEISFETRATDTLKTKKIHAFYRVDAMTAQLIDHLAHAPQKDEELPIRLSVFWL